MHRRFIFLCIFTSFRHIDIKHVKTEITLSVKLARHLFLVDFISISYSNVLLRIGCNSYHICKLFFTAWNFRNGIVLNETSKRCSTYQFSSTRPHSVSWTVDVDVDVDHFVSWRDADEFELSRCAYSKLECLLINCGQVLSICLCITKNYPSLFFYKKKKKKEWMTIQF